MVDSVTSGSSATIPRTSSQSAMAATLPTGNAQGNEAERFRTNASEMSIM